jgi:hypothetical protein
VSEGKAEKRRLSGREISWVKRKWSILEGLQEGEEVITQGAKYLREGTEVEVENVPNPNLPEQ